MGLARGRRGPHPRGRWAFDGHGWLVTMAARGCATGFQWGRVCTMSHQQELALLSSLASSSWHIHPRAATGVPKVAACVVATGPLGQWLAPQWSPNHSLSRSQVLLAGQEYMFASSVSGCIVGIRVGVLRCRAFPTVCCPSRKRRLEGASSSGLVCAARFGRSASRGHDCGRNAAHGETAW